MEFSKGSDNKAADALSRLPLPNTGEPGDQPDYSTRILQSQMEDLNLTRKQLKQETTKDRLLQKVIEFVERGWPQKQQLGEGMTTFFEKREEISFEEGTLVWNGRVIMPSSRRRRSPSEVLMKKKLRTRLTLLKPDISRKMDKTLFQQKKNHDRATKGRYFEEGDPVWVLNSGGKGWSEGKVLHRTGPLSYKVQVGPTQKRKHADQLRSASPA